MGGGGAGGAGLDAGHGLDALLDVAEDVVDHTLAVDGYELAEVLVVLAQGLGLGVVYLEAAGYGLGVVVGAAALQSSLEQALGQVRLGDVEAHDGVQVGALAAQQLLQGVGLRDGAREAVEDHASGAGRDVLVELLLQNLHHQLVGDEVALGNVLVGGLAVGGVAGYVVAQHIAGADVVQPVFVDYFCTLGAFAAAGGAE